MKAYYSKCYADAKRELHTCTPCEYKSKKALLNYYYKKLKGME